MKALICMHDKILSISNSDGGTKLHLPKISLNNAGKYACTADNGVGDPVSEEMNLKVLCKYGYKLREYYYFKFSDPPSAVAEQDLVLAGGDCGLDLVCNVAGKLF